MKKNSLVIFLAVLLCSSSVLAQDLKQFLKTSAVGMLGGATLGVVSLAFSDKPSESWNNVARGASLGLYAGIGYGLYRINQPEMNTYQTPDFAVVPAFKKGQVEGLHVVGTLWQF